MLDKISQGQLYTEGIKIYKYNGATWAKLNTSNLDNQYNAGVTSFEVYNNQLYAGTIRFGYSFALDLPSTAIVTLEPKGCQLLRTSGGPGYAWSVAADNGFTNTRNLACLSMRSYMGKLYMGTASATVTIRYNTSTQALDYSYDSGGLYIYSYTGSGSPVELVKNGFGSSNDVGALCMDEVTSGGKDRLLVGTASGSSPGKLEVYDGKSWSAGAVDGFGDANNSGIVSLVRVSESGQDKAYAGTLNSSAGCQVWAGTPSSAVNWYLAEGSSNWGFDTLVTIENPNPQVVTARVTCQTSAGAKSKPDIKLPALSQTVLNPRNDLGAADFSTRVECVEGKPIAVDRRVTWTGQGAASQEGHYFVGVTAASPVWYLAEGSSNWGFQTWLLIQNPGTAAATCKVTYVVEGVGPKTFTKVVSACTRATFNMADDIGAADASIKVVGSQPVICERAMNRNNKREGSDSIGTTGPAKDYYLAEGTTAWGFTTYVLIQNPNGSGNTVNITYMTPTGSVKQAAFVVPANSRKTIKVTAVVPGTDLSTHVQGSLPLIAERSMYWDRGLGEACHDSIGMMSNPHATFYLPDGETGNGYETWTLVQNPNSTPVTAEISYLTPDGLGNVVFSDTIPANSRRTYNMVDKGIGGRAAVMVRSLTSGKKIMVERAMYWNNRGAGTDTIGGYSD